MKIFLAAPLEKSGEAGTLFSDEGAFCVHCGTGALRIIELQPQDGKRMSGESFLLGHPLLPGAHFD